MRVLSWMGKNWTVGEIATLPEVLEQIHEDRLTWVRAGGFSKEHLEELGREFELHPLAIEDVQHTRQRPKVEDYPDLTFVVVRVPRIQGLELEWQQVGLFLGTDFLVTASRSVVPELDGLEKQLLARGFGHTRETSCSLLHAALDAIVDAWFPFMDHLEETIEDLEDRASETPIPDLLAEIRSMKRLASQIRKVSQPMRDAMLHLERSPHPNIQEETRLYLRDVSDHMVRIQERLEHVKEMALIAQETWNATLANQQNQVMKRLTVIAALLLFPGLVAGLGGMNFESGFPAWGYWQVTAAILSFIVLGLSVAWWKRWL